MINVVKKEIIEKVKINLGYDVIVEEPKKGNADLAIPLFSISKAYEIQLIDVYNKIIHELNQVELIDRFELIGGFLNIYLKRIAFSKRQLLEIERLNASYGSKTLKNEKTIVIDYSSPNIAKSFSVGHLRSTVIGNSLKNIYQKNGYKVVSINHLGDWGTQFGKMIVAYKLWGKKELIDKDPITELQKLYVRFHEESNNNPNLEDDARLAFLELEKNNPEYIKLWKWFREESLKEFMDLYDLLNVHFDSYDGEAFFNDKIEPTVKLLEAKNLLKLDEGAYIVDLGDDIPPALIKKSDGATLYLTRDLTALLYRKEKYNFDKILYVVGNEQKLYFTQLKRVTDLLGYNFDLEHINFGLVLIEGKKMSTRGGKTERLEAVIKKSIELAKETIIEKNPNLKNKDQVAKAVGVGAIIFNDLKNERHLDIDFNLNNMLKFEGQTGPYLQYTGVRISSILREDRLDIENINYDVYYEDDYFSLVKQTSQFPTLIDRAMDMNAPSVISRYLLSLSQNFNSFYGKNRILVGDQKVKNANLLLITAIKIILDEGLRLLGIESLEEM